MKKKAKKKKAKAGKTEDDDASSVASSRASRSSRASSRSAQSAARAGTETRSSAAQVRQQQQPKPKLEEIQESAPAAGSIPLMAFTPAPTRAEHPTADEQPVAGKGIEAVEVDKVHISIQPDMRRAPGDVPAFPPALAAPSPPLPPPSQPALAPMRAVPLAAAVRGGDGRSGGEGCAAAGSRVLGAPVFSKKNLQTTASSSLPTLSRPLPAVAAAEAAALSLHEDAVEEQRRGRASAGEEGGAAVHPVANAEDVEGQRRDGVQRREGQEEGAEGLGSRRGSQDDEMMSCPSRGESVSAGSSTEEEEEEEDKEREPSSSDGSEDERREAVRRQFFQDAYCVRASDSEDDITDLVNPQRSAPSRVEGGFNGGDDDNDGRWW
jgi:hypothetical protein